jgi:hypothetical protein
MNPTNFKAPHPKGGGPVDNRTETLAREVFVRLVESPHSATYGDAHLAELSIKAANAFYDTWNKGN